MKLEFNQMETITETDFVWFFNHSAADMGIKSNWTAMVSASCFGGSEGFRDSTNSFILNSVAHYRDLEKVFKALPVESQEILFATYADVPIKKQVQKIFKKHSGAAYCSFLSVKELEELCLKFIETKASQADKSLISKIRIDALSNYSKSVEQYVELKFKFNRTRK